MENASFKMKKTPFIISIIIILILTWYYFIFSARPITPSFINAIIAFSSTIIIGISFLIGPLAFFKPLRRLLIDRKTYGLIGFGLATIHVLISIPIMMQSERTMLFSDIGSMVFAGICFTIFLAMSLTSTQEWMNKLGYYNWKNLQRTGYFAFVFLLAHIYLLRQGFFLSTQLGQIVFVFGAIVLLARVIILILNKTIKKNSEN